MTLDTRWEDVDQLLDRTARTIDDKRAKAIQEIAARRFQFPTPKHPAYRTHVNVPDVAMGVQVGREEIAPDIVVVEKLTTGETHLVISVAVANAEQVSAAEAKRTWARYAAIKDVAFYLYVPVGYGARAKQICRKLKISVEGFRTYRTTPRGFEINDVSEQPSPLAALMPPIVRKILATP
ncbi:MAG: hypothetical protein IVW36_12290 [Dehalococcoidia bacterium]|nr:hypothetical protein [Dehalococcoidia bacterium]